MTLNKNQTQEGSVSGTGCLPPSGPRTVTDLKQSGIIPLSLVTAFSDYISIKVKWSDSVLRKQWSEHGSEHDRGCEGKCSMQC